MTHRKRLLDLRSGGWLLLLAVLLVALLVWWMVVPVLRSSSKAVGDGRHVESYGFDLASFTRPRDTLVAAGFPRDGVPSLDAPETMPGSEVASFNEAHRGKYLVSDDRVIGVTLNGETRAYPLRVLNWHEVVNDTLGGVPVAVTYHPLCDSAVVFDRRVGDEVLRFGVSGLLYNSNLLLFDRREDGGAESLWSQLLARAVSGPAAEAGARLRVLPASAAHWRRWLERYPETTVLAPDPDRIKRYQRDPYGNYFMTGELRFPVRPLPPEGSAPPMSPVVALESAGRTDAYLLEHCLTAESDSGFCDEAGLLEASRAERSFGVILGEGVPDDAAVYHAAWFAWHAMREEPERPAR